MGPKPLSDEVYIQQRDPTMYFVRQFSGWALSNSDWEGQLKQLKDSLMDRMDQMEEGVFFTVSFDSPFHNGPDRRNEIWIPTKEGVSIEKAQIQKEKTEDLDYMVLEKTTEFELRRYGEERWACTEEEDITPDLDPMNGWQEKYDNNPYEAMAERKYKSDDRPSNKMFMRMFRYIQGVNSKYRTEEPPLPVPGQKVDIRKEKGFNVYVREFPGWAMSDSDYRKEYVKLVEDLEEVGESFDPEMWFHASYNSPFDQGPRRNEVWVPKLYG